MGHEAEFSGFGAADLVVPTLDCARGRLLRKKWRRVEETPDRVGQPRISIANYGDIKIGDVIEAFVTERIAAETIA